MGMGGFGYKYNLLMGNDNLKREPKEVRPENDIRIGHQKFQHFRLDEEQDLIEVTTEVESERDIKAWDNQLKRVNSFQDRETLLLPVKHLFTPRGFCGNVGSVKIYYENYPYLFEEQIESRTTMGKHFDEEELWYLLYSLVSSARDFNKIERKIGDVRPYNIFINDEGQIKIANLYSWPYEKTNFEKTAFEKQLTYLSPEEMRLIAKGNHENTTDRLLSETFSIGLTLLQSGLLTDVRQIYSVDNYSVDFNKLAHKLGEWQNLQFLTQNNTNAYLTYSPLLKQIVSRMCNADERERLSSLQVEDALRPYQNEILNLKEFDHRNVQLPGNVQQSRQVEVVQRTVQGTQQPGDYVQRPVSVQVMQRTVDVQRPVEMQRPVQTGQRPVQLSPGSGRPTSQPNQPVFTIPQQTIKVGAPMQPKINVQRSSEGSPVKQPVHLHPSEQQKFYKANSPNKNVSFNAVPISQIPQSVGINMTNVGHNTQSVSQQAYEQQFYKYANLNQNPGNLPSQIQNQVPVFSKGPVPVQLVQNLGMNLPRPLSNSQSNGLAAYGQGSNPAQVYRGTVGSQPTFAGNQPSFMNNQPVYAGSNEVPGYLRGQAAQSQFVQRVQVNQGGKFNLGLGTGFNPTVARPTSVGGGLGGGDGASDFLKRIDEQLQNSRRQFPS